MKEESWIKTEYGTGQHNALIHITAHFKFSVFKESLIIFVVQEITRRQAIQSSKLLATDNHKKN